MKIQTKLFHEIEVDKEKVIVFQGGIIGFPELTEFMLVHDMENSDAIRWLQSIQEPAFAIPVINPLELISDYNPAIEDELLKPLAISAMSEMLVLVTITIPTDLKKMSVNLRAPIIINAENLKGSQIIVDNDKYQVKYLIYELLEAAKEKVGD